MNNIISQGIPRFKNFYCVFSKINTTFSMLIDMMLKNVIPKRLIVTIQVLIVISKWLIITTRAPIVISKQQIILGNWENVEILEFTDNRTSPMQIFNNKMPFSRFIVDNRASSHRFSTTKCYFRDSLLIIELQRADFQQ